MADGGVKGKDAIPIEIDQRTANQKGPLQMAIEVTPLETIEGNKDVTDADKRGTLKETA